MDIKKAVRVGIATLLVRDGKILLGKRHDDPEKASSELSGEGTWTIPGGKMEFGESFEEGASRETLEETGIKVNKEKLKFISVSNETRPDVHFVTLGFLSHDFEGEPQVTEPDEITEWRWFGPNDLPKPMFPPAEKVIKNYLAEKFYKH